MQVSSYRRWKSVDGCEIVETAFFDPVKETRKVRPGANKERREAVGFQASRGVLFRFEVEMARAKTAQQCPDNGRVFVEAGK